MKCLSFHLLKWVKTGEMYFPEKGSSDRIARWPHRGFLGNDKIRASISAPVRHQIIGLNVLEIASFRCNLRGEKIMSMCSVWGIPREIGMGCCLFTKRQCCVLFILWMVCNSVKFNLTGCERMNRFLDASPCIDGYVDNRAQFHRAA